MNAPVNPARILRDKIADDSHITTGMLCTFHFWPGMVEMAMEAGLDYLIIDLEHLTYDAEMVAHSCAIGRREGFPILIRPPAAEFTPIRLAMDGSFAVLARSQAHRNRWLAFRTPQPCGHQDCG